MSASILLVQLLSGLAHAMVLFLIASGLSLIFGVTRVVNFAHGSLYMLAAYAAYTLTDALPLGAASFYVAIVLAALGGALQVPRQALSIVMDTTIITEAFVVVVIGGMGSVPGALLAAVLIGVIDAFGVLVLPRASLVLTFVVMAVVLVVRPWGLLGRPEAQARSAGGAGIAHADVGVPRALVVVVAALLVAIP